MKVKIKYDRFRALSLARADENQLYPGLQGIWLDFEKNRVMATDRRMMMITLPDCGMEIETAPTENAHLNILAVAVERILKLANKKAEYLTIESADETNAVITDGAARVRFTFDKSEMPEMDKYIHTDGCFDSKDKNFFGKAVGAQFIRKAGKAAMILNKRQPYIRFYPSLSKEEGAPVNIIIDNQILMVIMPMDSPRCHYLLDWNNWEQAA